MMSPEIDDLIRRRRDALSAFIEENGDLFGVQQSEVDRICEDHDEGVSDGPFMLTRWVIVTESQSMSDPDEGLVNIMRRPGTTYTDQLGLLKRALDQ